MKLRRLDYRILTCLVLLLWVPVYATARENEPLTWVEGRFFDIIGTDHRSVYFANELGDNVVEIGRRYLRAGSHDFPRRIVVTLRPSEYVKFKGDYRLQVSPRGQVSLDFRWGESLRFESVCLGLTEAYLANYVRFNYGVGADERIRFWAVAALTARSYLSLRPAQRAAYIHKARESGIPGVKTLFSQHRKEWDEQRLEINQGYLMLQVLRESNLTDAAIASLLELAVAGVDVTDRVAELFVSESGELTANDLEQWWQSQLADYLAREYEFCESLEVSQSWLEEMGDVDTFRASGGTLKSLMELWEHRNDEAIRSVLSARCEIIRLRIEQVNPAYFNAAVSLGAFYETVLEAEHKHRFISTFAVYLNDWEDARRLHSRVVKLLNYKSL